MKKLIIQGLLVTSSFFVLWYALSLIDWMKVMKVQEISAKAEENLGDLYWDFFKNSGNVITDEEVIRPLDSIIYRICSSNNIDLSTIKLHVLDNGEVNAFALPGRHIVVFTGLILETENESQLAGVISHEIAHLEEGHIMNRLVKEVGISVLLGAVSGNNGQVISQTAELLSSTAYDRSLEKRADLLAIDYMVQADIDPEPFANFIGSLGSTDQKISKYLAWISTHPGEEERMKYLQKYCHQKQSKPKPVLSQLSWDKMINAITITLGEK